VQRGRRNLGRACREGEGICFLLGCGWRGFGGAVLRGVRGAGVFR